MRRWHAWRPRNFIVWRKPRIKERGRFSVALSGGNTPRAVFSLLADEHKELPWDRIHVFFGDERHVPPDHPDSNFRMASESLLSKVPIPEENVHRIHAELEPEDAAKDYDEQLAEFFQLINDDWPRFDLIFLGLGDDGHTASLFPGSSALSDLSSRVAANWVEKLQTFRITLTFPVLNHAADVIFLVSGESKAQILSAVLRPGRRKVSRPGSAAGKRPIALACGPGCRPPVAVCKSTFQLSPNFPSFLRLHFQPDLRIINSE